VTEVFAALDAACSAPRRIRAEEKRATTPFRLFGIAAHEAQVEAYMQVAREVASRSASPSTLVCEVGFNCGHSSAAFLEADERIHVLNFDLPYYSWATAGRNFMRERYGSRIRVIDGSSLTTLPAFARSHPAFRECELVVVDGSHRYRPVLADLQNALQLARCGASVLLDDVCDPFRCHAHIPASMFPRQAGVNHPGVVGPTQAWTAAKAAGLIAERRAWFEEEDRGWVHGRARCNASGRPAIPAQGFPAVPEIRLRYEPDVRRPNRTKVTRG